uniref:Protein kinase domain-containing protein n=1 Tax=Lates calcarifer TaxID=8187 RepID=A0A4W6EAR8_LATCA
MHTKNTVIKGKSAEYTVSMLAWPHPLKIKLIVFGSACDASKAAQGSFVQPRWYRAPETIMGLPFNEAIDMWSLGCIVAELFLGFPLYPGKYEYEIIWHIIQTQGPLPEYFLSAGLHTSHFYKKTWPNLWELITPYECRCIPLNSLDDLKELQQKPVSLMSVANFMAEKDHLELVKQMLPLRPTQRRTLRQVLQHTFFTMVHLKDF